MEQELLILPEHLSSTPVFSGFRFLNFSFMCVFCRSLFVLLYFFFWPLCCLFFFDIWILITPLVSLSSSLIAVESEFLSTKLTCSLASVSCKTRGTQLHYILSLRVVYFINMIWTLKVISES